MISMITPTPPTKNPNRCSLVSSFNSLKTKNPTRTGPSVIPNNVIGAAIASSVAYTVAAVFVLVVVVRTNELRLWDYFNFYAEFKVVVNIVRGKGAAAKHTADRA